MDWANRLRLPSRKVIVMGSIVHASRLLCVPPGRHRSFGIASRSSLPRSIQEAGNLMTERKCSHQSSSKTWGLPQT